METIRFERNVFTEDELKRKLQLRGDLEDVEVQSTVLGVAKVSFVMGE